MTTERPYSRARSAAEAAEEIRRGRGTQFAPAVVDAFFRVLERSGAAERDPIRTTQRLPVPARSESQPA